jgi:hypothetical protein
MKLTLAVLLSVCSLAAQPNALTPKEKADGWILLFDGKTLTGWDQGTQSTWRAQDGVLVADTGDALNLRSTATYSDFILKIDFRNSPKGNSGVFLRSALEGKPEVTGYELQVWNESPTFPTGSLVNTVKAKPVSPAADEWHTYEVTAQGDHYVVVLDGDTVLDAHDGKSKEGYFLLQYNRGRKIEFRNIKLKKL